MIKCENCKTENPAEAPFCLSCAARLILMYPQCGTELPPAAKFCYNCASPVATPPSVADEEPGAIALHEAIQRLVPKEYAE